MYKNYRGHGSDVLFKKKCTIKLCLVLRYASSKSTIEQCVFAVLSALCQLVLRHASSKCYTA